jgi:hypothetical protein
VKKGARSRDFTAREQRRGSHRDEAVKEHNFPTWKIQACAKLSSRAMLIRELLIRAMLVRKGE